MRRKALFGFIVCYLVLYIIIFSSFGDEMIFNGILFVSCNLIICILFFLSIKISPVLPFYLLIYSVFTLVYIFKGVLQYSIGLNTFYSLITIRTHVTHDDYLRSLEIIFISHIILSITLIFLNIILNFKSRSYSKKAYLTNYIINKAISFSFYWIIISSILMYILGVAVMGTDNIRLPYRLSGIFFYSRTIVLPLLMIYFLEKALNKGDITLFKRTILAFVLLSLSEVFVRASKAPLFILLLQILSLYIFLGVNGNRILIHIKRKYVLLTFATALALWPIVEVYRTMKVNNEVSSQILYGVSDYVGESQSNYFIFTLERLMQRMGGFMQFSGIVADNEVKHNISEVIDYGSIAHYYTKRHLGFDMEGHLSSPSLLGASFIISYDFWYLIFIGYIILMTITFRIALRFRHMGLPVISFLCVEVFNTIIAGTIDASMVRIGMVFAVGAAFEIIIKIRAGTKFYNSKYIKMQ